MSVWSKSYTGLIGLAIVQENEVWKMGTEVNLGDLLSAITALLAVIISVFSYFLSKRRATIEHITVNIMDWIKEVRRLCGDFLLEFNRDPANVDKLKELYLCIQLYGYGKPYEALFQALEACIDHVDDTSHEKKEFTDKALLCAQQVLQDVWWRMKREAGISERADNKMKKLYDSRSKTSGA